MRRASPHLHLSYCLAKTAALSRASQRLKCPKAWMNHRVKSLLRVVLKPKSRKGKRQIYSLKSRSLASYRTPRRAYSVGPPTSCHPISRHSSWSKKTKRKKRPAQEPSTMKRSLSKISTPRSIHRARYSRIK